MATSGMKERILAEITRMRPMGEEINVVVAEGMRRTAREAKHRLVDPVLDAWKGAQLYVSKLREQFLNCAATKESYDECGAVVVKPYFASNWA